MIEHPDHRVPADIREALDRRHQYQLQAAAARFEFSELLRPSDQARKDKAALLETVGRALGIDAGKYRTTVGNRFDRLAAGDVFAGEPYANIFELDALDVAPRRPGRCRPSFLVGGNRLVASGSVHPPRAGLTACGSSGE